jgi:hypothetical protein
VPERPPSLTSNEIEAANRAEATAILIRAGYRVYRPEADVKGEDLIVRTPSDELRAVQLKARAEVDWSRYGGRQIWMLFPDQGGIPGRAWFLVEHDRLFDWMKQRHAAAPKWNDYWSNPKLSAELRAFLQPFTLHAAQVQVGR